MNWNAIPGIACMVSLTLPIAVILFHRYYKHRSLAALLAYYSIVLIYLIMSRSFIPIPKNFIQYFGVLTNYLDVPLMLTALVFFCPNKPKQNIVRMLCYFFISYEVIVTCVQGFKSDAIVYIMAPGFLIVISYAFYLFVRQVKFSIMHGKNYGRVIMLTAVLFSYFCYTLVYYFYYVQKNPDVENTELIYFIATIISALAMAVGLQLMNKRMKELQSLRTTRKELAMFFNQ